MCVLTRHIEPWEVREGVEVAGSASSTHWGHYLPIQRAIGQSSIWSITTWHAPLLWKLGLETRGWATLPEPCTHPHHPPILVACRRDGEGGSGWPLIARGAALSRQVTVSLIWGGVTAVHWVTVQTGASLGYLRYRWVTAQNWTSLGVGYRWLSAEHGAALHRLAQGWLSAEDWASLRPLSHWGLSAEDWAALSSLRQTTTKDGTATETYNTHLEAISWWCLLACNGTIWISIWALLRDGVVGGEAMGWVAKDVGPILCMGTSMADHCLGGFWGGWAGIWGHIVPLYGVGAKVGQCRGSSAMVGRGRRAGIQVGRSGGIEGLIRWRGSGVGTLCSLGAVPWISSGLGRSAYIALC